MSSKAVCFSPKVEIINHFDELINKVDIDIEECLEKYNEHQILGDLECFQKNNRNFKKSIYKYYCMTNKDINLRSEYYTHETVDLWTESTKVIDYLNRIRMTTIGELRKAQEETLEYYKLNSSQFKSLKDENTIDDLRSKLFGEKFYFQVKIKKENNKNRWIFNLFTFLTDFYMSQSDIDILEKVCNNMNEEKERFLQEENATLDEKMVLISLIFRQFMDNLTTENYPSHVIFVSKKDILDIEEIKAPSFVNVVKLNCSSIDLSKLQQLSLDNYVEFQEIDLDGLCSLRMLRLKLNSLERFSAKNLTKLLHLGLVIEEPIIENTTVVFEGVSNIFSLHLKGSFSKLNLDNFVYLEDLELYGKINADFNCDLFKNLCNHLQRFASYLICDQKQITKLFYGYIFPSLLILHIKNSNISKLENKLFQGFQMLQTLNIVENKNLRTIDSDAFSSLINLVELNLNGNRIEQIDNRTFSSLIQLKTLNLRDNYITIIENNTFSNLKNLRELDLRMNRDLSVLNPQSFSGLENLQELNLGFCKLSMINPQTFIGLSNLKSLSIRNNQLGYFDLRIFEILIKIEKIYIYGNKISNKDEILESCKASKIHFC